MFVFFFHLLCIHIINHIYFQLTPEDTIDLTGGGPAPDIEGGLVLTVEPTPEVEEEIVQTEDNVVVDGAIAVNTAVQESVVLNDQICGTAELHPQPQTPKNIKSTVGIKKKKKESLSLILKVSETLTLHKKWYNQS